MKNFFRIFITITVITLLLMLLLEKGYFYAFEFGQPRSKIHYIFQDKDIYDVAFFGSSRTQNHINCELITELTGKSCVNFGISGGSPGDMLILMKLAENRDITFNKVFMQVDYNFNSNEITEHFKANIVGPFIANPVVKEQLQNYPQDNIYGRIPFYYYMKYDKKNGLRELTASFLKKKPLKQLDFEMGFSPLQGMGKNVAGSFPASINDNSQELDQMQELYKNTNTTIEFFTAPYCNEIKNRNFMDKVQSKLPGLHNYMDLFQNKDDYFYNCGHLNKEGAEVFTKIIIEDLIK